MLTECKAWQFILADAISISDGGSTARATGNVGTYASSARRDSRSIALSPVPSYSAIFATGHQRREITGCKLKDFEYQRY